MFLAAPGQATAAAGRIDVAVAGPWVPAADRFTIVYRCTTKEHEQGTFTEVAAVPAGLLGEQAFSDALAGAGPTTVAPSMHGIVHTIAGLHPDATYEVQVTAVGASDCEQPAGLTTTCRASMVPFDIEAGQDQLTCALKEGLARGATVALRYRAKGNWQWVVGAGAGLVSVTGAHYEFDGAGRCTIAGLTPDTVYELQTQYRTAAYISRWVPENSESPGTRFEVATAADPKAAAAPALDAVAGASDAVPPHLASSTATAVTGMYHRIVDATSNAAAKMVGASEAANFVVDSGASISSLTVGVAAGAATADYETFRVRHRTRTERAWLSVPWVAAQASAWTASGVGAILKGLAAGATYDLQVSVTLRGGDVLQWGPDEPLAATTPSEATAVAKFDFEKTQPNELGVVKVGGLWLWLRVEQRQPLALVAARPM